MKAIKIVKAGNATIQDVPIPEPRDNELLIKVTAVALNPTDWKHIHLETAATPGVTVGCDYAGIVEKIGSKVTKPFKLGDHVAGFTHGANFYRHEDGTFAEYAVVIGDISIKVPSNLTDEEAATLGVGIITVGQALCQNLGLPIPGEGKYDGYVLVYGGSTATGSLGIQYAKLMGANVIATCSPRNFEFVKSLGADEAFDYKDPDVAKKIREYTKDSLTKIFDCISEAGSSKICDDAMSSKGGKVADLLKTTHERAGVDSAVTLAYTSRGLKMQFRGTDIPAQPEHYEFAKKWWELSYHLLADGKIVVHPPEVRKGGLAGVFEGLDDLKNNRVSGKKLVYSL